MQDNQVAVCDVITSSILDKLDKDEILKIYSAIRLLPLSEYYGGFYFKYILNNFNVNYLFCSACCMGNLYLAKLLYNTGKIDKYHKYDYNYAFAATSNINNGIHGKNVIKWLHENNLCDFEYIVDDAFKYSVIALNINIMEYLYENFAVENFSLQDAITKIMYKIDLNKHT